MYLLQVEGSGLLNLLGVDALVVVDGVILLIIESDACLVLADSIVAECLQDVGPLVYNNLVGLVGVFVVDQIEFVLRQLLNGEVGAAEGALSGKNVRGFGGSSCSNVVHIRLVCLLILHF